MKVKLQSTDIKLKSMGIDEKGNFAVFEMSLLFPGGLGYKRKEMRLYINQYVNFQTDDVKEIFYSGMDIAKYLIYRTGEFDK